MSQGIEIRSVRRGETAEVVYLHRSAFPEVEVSTEIFSGHGVSTYLASLIAHPNLQTMHYFHGVWEEGHLVAYAHFRDLGENWHLNQIAVAPTYQGHGFATILFDLWLRKGAEMGKRKYSLDVTDSNRAKAWYSRHGFIPVEYYRWMARPLLNDTGGERVASPILLDWENAEAWQSAYGFSMFQLQFKETKYSVGRLGDKYFRVYANIPNEVERSLRVIDGRRELLMLCDGSESNKVCRHIRTSVRMERRIL